MTTAWAVRLGTGELNVEKLVEAGYLGVDFVQDYDIRDHLGQGPEAFRKARVEKRFAGSNGDHLMYKSTPASIREAE